MKQIRRLYLLQALRPGARLAFPLASSQPFATRSYVSQNDLGAATTPGLKRRSITPFNDNGTVPWTELSVAEKAARATQQSVKFGIVLLGLTLTGAVGYFLWTEVFSPDSKISQFNRAVDRIKKDSRCVELLGDVNKITAHGEASFNKWRRARPLASSEQTDSQGNAHLLMHFHVDGPLRTGIAQLHLVRRRGESDYEYKHFFVDIQGQERIYLENSESKPGLGKKHLKILGVKWS